MPLVLVGEARVRVRVRVRVIRGGLRRATCKKVCDGGFKCFERVNQGVETLKKNFFSPIGHYLHAV